MLPFVGFLAGLISGLLLGALVYMIGNVWKEKRSRAEKSTEKGKEVSGQTSFHGNAKKVSLNTDTYPDKRDDWKLVLVNESHPLEEGGEPDLVEIVEDRYVDARILNEANGMLEDAAVAGMDLYICSAYRDYENNTFMERAGVLNNMEPKESVSRFWYSSSAAWRKEDKTLDESRVKEFLGKLKQAYGEPAAPAEENEDSATAGSAQPNRLAEDDIIRGEFKMLEGSWNVSAGLFGTNPDYALLLAVTEQLESGNFGCMTGQAEHVFVPSVTVGISSKGSQPETAEQFVKYLD